MKHFINIGKLLTLTLALLPLQAIASCPDNVADMQSFRAFWGQLIKTVNQKDPQKLIKFYQFPLKMLSPTDQDKDISLSQKTFIQYYQEIFVTPSTAYESLFTKEAKRYLTDNFEQYSLTEHAFKNGCLSKVYKNYFYFGVFGFTWNPTSGWKVTEVYVDEYYDVKPFLRSKKALVYWKNPKK